MPDRTRQQCAKLLSYEQAWRTYSRGRRIRSSWDSLGEAVAALEVHARESVVARFLLATVLSDPETPVFDARRAIAHYARCVKEGLPDAAEMLADVYSGQLRMPRNLSRRFFWLMEGRKLGSAKCVFQAGLALVAGRGVRRDASQGLDLIREAVDYPDARGVIGLLDLLDAEGRERTHAVEQLDAAAECGSSEAWVIRGALSQSKWISGGATPPLECYRRAARTGNAAAMWNLHVCYAAGLGVDRSSSKARYWRRRSGESLVYPMESDRSKVGVHAWGWPGKLYPLPMIGILVLSSYEELSALLSGASLAGPEPPVRRSALQGDD